MAEKIEQRIAELGARLAPGDTFIFYFSGHGKAHADDHYLLLTGARLAAFDSGAVVTSGVLSYRALKHLTSGAEWQGVHRLFIIDACRDHLIGSKKSVGILPVFDGDYLLKDFKTGAKASQAAIEKNLTLLNSCTLGSCALEIPALGHGVFTAALLDTMRKTKNSAQGLAINSSFAQTLALSMDKLAHLSGLPKEVRHQPAFSGNGLQLLPNTEASIGSSDETEWAIAKAKGTAEALETYIRRFPHGPHQDDALSLLSKLTAASLTRRQTAKMAQGESVQPKSIISNRTKLTDGIRNWRTSFTLPGKFIWLALGLFTISLFLPSGDSSNGSTVGDFYLSILTEMRSQNNTIAMKILVFIILISPLVFIIATVMILTNTDDKRNIMMVSCISTLYFISFYLNPLNSGHRDFGEAIGGYCWTASFACLAIGMFLRSRRVTNPPA